MIIKFPTSLYNSTLPTDESSGNVTYTISSNDPPRSVANSIQLPVAERIRPLPDKIFTRKENRETFGELVFLVSKSSASGIGSNIKAFEVGEFLEFEETLDAPPELTNTEVPEIIDLQQNTNLISLDSLGLTGDESSSITNDAESKIDEVTEEINELKELIDNNKALISENQKAINETESVIKATKVIYPDGSSVTDKLEESKIELIAQRDSLISETNTLNDTVKQRFLDLTNLRKLVR